MSSGKTSLSKAVKLRAGYADGFLIVIPKKNLDKYKKISMKAGKIWIEHGAIDFIESAGEDLSIKSGKPFPGLLKLKKNETVLFSWITFKSRAHRDKVNLKAMTDPRLNKMMNDSEMPFDMKRMSYGGFKIIVRL